MVGYPQQWRDYSRLEVRSDDLYGDVIRGTAFEWDRKLGHLNQPVDRAEWDVTPQSFDAYYEPASDEVVLPSGILQAPFFDRHASSHDRSGRQWHRSSPRHRPGVPPIPVTDGAWIVN